VKGHAVKAYDWQKSSYSNEGANCVDVAAALDGTIRLRESDEPDVTLPVTRAGLSGLLLAIKAGPGAGVRTR
jgi:hypothetical protein